MKPRERRVSVTYRGVEVYLGAAGWTSDQVEIDPERMFGRALEAVDVALAKAEKRHVEQSAGL